MAGFDIAQQGALLTVDGTANGIVTLASVLGYYVDAKLWLSSTTQPSVECIIIAISGATLQLRATSTTGFGGYGSFNAAPYLVADGARVDMPSQFVASAVKLGFNDFFVWDGTTLTPTVPLAGGGGAGTVTSVSVTTANGVSGSVATATTTPAITLTLGAITPTTVSPSGLVSSSVASGSNAIKLLDGARLMFSTADASAYLYRSAADTIRTPGALTVDGVLTGSNLSGTNTGDVTIATFGSSPTANGATISGQAITLQPADATNPGLITTGIQTIAGAKTLSSVLTLSAATTGLTFSGGAASWDIVRATNDLNMKVGANIYQKWEYASGKSYFPYGLDTASNAGATLGLNVGTASGNNAIKLLDGARLNFSSADASAYLYRSAADTIRTPGALTVDGVITSTAASVAVHLKTGAYLTFNDGESAFLRATGAPATIVCGDNLAAVGNVSGATISTAGTYTSTVASGSNAFTCLDGARINVSTADASSYFSRSATDTIGTPGSLSAFKISLTNTGTATTDACISFADPSIGQLIWAQSAGNSWILGRHNTGANQNLNFTFGATPQFILEAAGNSSARATYGFDTGASAQYRVNGKLFAATNAPTISSGFGTGASVTNHNGTIAFRIDVGTTPGGTGVIGLPTAATGWIVNVQNISNPAASVVSQTATSTTSASIANYGRVGGVAGNWTDNDILLVTATAY